MSKGAALLVLAVLGWVILILMALAFWQGLTVLYDFATGGKP